MEEFKAGVPPTSELKVLALSAKAIFNYERKENMTSPRKILTPDETTFVLICFKNIRIDLLKSKQADFLKCFKKYQTLI